MTFLSEDTKVAPALSHIPRLNFNFADCLLPVSLFFVFCFVVVFIVVIQFSNLLTILLPVHSLLTSYSVYYSLRGREVVGKEEIALGYLYNSLKGVVKRLQYCVLHTSESPYPVE